MINDGFILIYAAVSVKTLPADDDKSFIINFIIRNEMTV